MIFYLIPIYYCGMSFTCTVPNHWILVCSFFYFAWVILDNIDGKQARRTKNSSPLGLIFDHQVDALSVTLTTSYLSIVTLYGNSTEALVLWILGAFPFYLATWEELFVGEQIFPFINGPSEGCVLIGLLCISFGVFGPEAFVVGRLFGYRAIDFLLYTFSFGSAIAGGFR